MNVKTALVSSVLIIALITANVLAEDTNLLDVQNPSGETDEYYRLGEQIRFAVHAFNSTGGVLNGTSDACGLRIYDSQGRSLQNATLTLSGSVWAANVTNTDIIDVVGTYSYIAVCTDNSGHGGFYSGSFRVNIDGANDQNSDLSPIAITLSIPFILSALLLAGAFYFKNDDEHRAYRLGLYWLSLIVLLAGIGYPLFVLEKFFSATSFVTTINSLQVAYVSFLIFAFGYWSIYLIVKAIDWARMKRNGGEE
jgi:hypothetical protein